jgi:multiple antibiotic resistance protein
MLDFNLLDFCFQSLKVALALYIIIDALGNLPFFIGLTEGTSKEERNKITMTAIFTGLILLSFFVFAGSLFFDLFNLTIDDVKIAGGILLFFISVEILMRGKVIVEHKEDVGVVPLGCPLLVGPGAITTALVMSHLYPLPAFVTGVLICFVFIWLTLHFADWFYRYIGHNGALIITKIAAILIASIAVRFVRMGIQAIFNI